MGRICLISTRSSEVMCKRLLELRSSGMKDSCALVEFRCFAENEFMLLVESSVAKVVSLDFWGEFGWLSLQCFMEVLNIARYMEIF